jgi:hypothetical protein
VSWPDASEIRWPHVTVTTGSDAPFGKSIKLEL